MNKNQNKRFSMEKESDIKAWESLHSNEVGEKFKSQNRFVIEKINYYYERVMRMQEDPYLETREIERRHCNMYQQKIWMQLRKESGRLQKKKHVRKPIRKL